MEDQTLESFVEERVAQLQAISQRRNALLRQMFHMVQKRQNVASVIKLQDEEGDEELAVFLDKFDLTKNPDTGSIDYFVQDHLVVSTPSPGPVVPSTRPSPTPSSPQHSEPPAPETAEPPTPETAEPPTPEIAEPPTPEIAELPTPETAQQPLPEPPVQDVSSPEPPVVESRSTPASRATPIPVPASPPLESDDELDLIGTPAKSVHTQIRAPSEIVHVVDAPAPESITVVNGDDSAEAKPITPSNGDTTDEEDLVQIVRPLEIVDPEVPIMVEDEMPKGQHEASPSSNEDPIHVQDVEATEDDVALPEADEPPPVEKDMDMVVEDDLFSAHDDLTPPPTTEPELEPEPEPEPVTDTLGPSTIKSLDDSEQLEVGASEDVMMHDDLPGPVEEAKDQLEVHTDRPTETARPETPLSEAESMVIDEPDNEDVQAEQTLGQVVAPAVFDSRVVDIAEYDTRESTPQPVVTLAAPTAPVFLRQAVTSLSPPPVFNFSPISASPLPAPPELTTPSQSRHSFLPTYTLPALKSLPAEFSRKSKPAKQQRKHKEREKSGGDKAKDKDDWAPLGISRWGATIRANPVHVKVSRAPKCLNSREWGVAMTELRLMRAFEQIESLKDAGRWSFRQPKKQRGIGGVTKTHWDYVMDEMKWMRTDFREERKWKLALAYNLSTAVLEWHSFSTHAERVAKGICVGWKPPRADLIPEQLMVDEDILPLEQPSMDVEDKEDKPAPSLSSARPTSLVDYGSDDDDDDEQEKQSVMDALEPSSALEEALDIAEKGPDTAAADSGFRDVEFKRGEDSEPPSAMSDATSKMDVDEEADAEAGKPDAEDKNSEEPTKPVELKDSSGDPMLSQADSIASMGESGVSVAPGAKAPAQANIYGPLREHLAYSDSTKLFLDLNDFDHVVMNASADELSADPAFPPTDLSEIFPDLPPLNMLDVAPPTVNTAEGKTKKSEKRADRDDPNKRIEDTMYTKLFPIGKFMYTKPTLIGPLQPAKRWKNGRWLNADDCPASDSDTPSTKPQDSLSDLFNPKFANSPKSLEQQLKEKEAKEAPRRVVHMWTPVDDNLLKSLADKYPNNWALIAECYNSARLTISTDKRSARDCQERWKERWAQEPPPKSQEATPDEPPPTPSSAVPPSMPPTPSMTTRGIKRLASASVSGPPPAASGSDAKKRRRHQFMQETIRKAGKKRAEAAQKALANQRKQPAVHETHAQYARLPKYSPAELSRMKAEKDFKDQQDLAQARRRHEELTRAAQGQRVPAGPQAQAQAQAAQQGQQGQQGQGAAAQTQAAQAQAHAQAAQQAQPGQAVPGQQQQQPQQVPASTQQTPSTQPQPQSAAQTAQMLQMQAMQAVQQQRAAAARNQVNISQQQVPQPQQQQQQQHPQQQQQQRIASPMTGVNPRLPMTPHQQILMQQQQARLAHGLLIQQQQNLQAQQAAAAASAAHANNVGVRAGTSSPRPPGAASAAVVPGNAVARGQAPYMMAAVQNLAGLQGYTQEQLQMVLQQHMQQAQLAQQQQQQQQQQQHQGHGG